MLRNFLTFQSEIFHRASLYCCYDTTRHDTARHDKTNLLVYNAHAATITEQHWRKCGAHMMLS